MGPTDENPVDELEEIAGLKTVVLRRIIEAGGIGLLIQRIHFLHDLPQGVDCRKFGALDLHFGIAVLHQAEAEILRAERGDPVPGADRPGLQAFQLAGGGILQCGKSPIDIPLMKLKEVAQVTERNL